MIQKEISLIYTIFLFGLAGTAFYQSRVYNFYLQVPTTGAAKGEDRRPQQQQQAPPAGSDNTSGSAAPHREPLPTGSPFANPRPARQLRQRQHDPPGPDRSRPRVPQPRWGNGAPAAPRWCSRPARLAADPASPAAPARPGLRGPQGRWATGALGPARHRPGASAAAAAGERRPGRRVPLRVRAPLPPCPEAGAAPPPPSYRARPGPLRRTNAGPPPPPPGRRRAGLARAALAANQRAGSEREHATAERGRGSAEAAGAAMAAAGR
ncbi:basic proline-rich protein-like [Ammospiza caudacuta]|uniref:basic proline-rich protein-like n=1 Tax=Ammospiza caudacuta TaxID=2857398 RepID=UPI00273A4B81|nr:basic proline-rich protein-like [Ammospiza caudacuta]